MKSLHVLLLVDLPVPENREDFENLLQGDDWKTEKNVLDALKELGHRVTVVGVYDKVEPIVQAVEKERPDIVFNMVEHFNNNAAWEKNVISLVEMMDLPYTGSGPTGLTLCKNKGLMKKLMNYHKIKSPKFSVLHVNRNFKKPSALKYPMIVKPAKEDASYGISQNSFVESDEALMERVKFVHEKMSQDALIEEYIEGRELYVGVMGNERLRVFTPREMVFGEVPDDEPKIATFKAKWDLEYRKKWGIQYRFANPMAEGVLEKIFKVCKKVYRSLNIQGYGRIDLRLTPNNEIMILEANPNPGIATDEELPRSAEKDGLAYNQFIQKILQLGLQAYEAQKK